MSDRDLSLELQSAVNEARSQNHALAIVGGNSKAFYGHAVDAPTLSVSAHRGITNYEPTELVISARAGTPLTELEQVLADNNQMLAFEPPAYGDSATLGGTIAGNFSGPRRAYAGAARDFVLGTRIINGRGEILRFGGEVMKNVAGYDVSRLMAGALGTLGVLLEVSLKVLPRPESEVTVVLERTALQAIADMNEWAQLPLPISATCHDGERLLVRLSGTGGAVKAARERIGGDLSDTGASYWQSLKEQQLAFFSDKTPLWRLSVASDAPPIDIDGCQLMEWGGSLRWLRSEANAMEVRAAARAAGGHAVAFRHISDAEVFDLPSLGVLRMHRQIKQALDPQGIFNPGRLYPGL